MYGRGATGVGADRDRRAPTLADASPPVPSEGVTSRFADHFSASAAGYARFRPRYPDALLAWLAEQVPARARAWDCAAGNGQAAVALASHFDSVVATEPSAAQVDAREEHARVRWVRATAEAVPLATASMDVATVAQALHWLDRDGFYAEARRVLRPGGVLAVWSYGLMTTSDAVDAIVRELHGPILGDCWPTERRWVDEGYASFDFPFDELAVPSFAMRAEWTLAELLGYLDTWSAVRVHRGERGADPIVLVRDRLADAWGDAERRTVRWPLAIRAGRA